MANSPWRAQTASLPFDEALWCGILLVIMRNPIVFSVLFCACCAALGQTAPAKSQPKTQPRQAAQSPDDQIQAQLTKIANATIGWEKSTTPGVKVDVIQIRKEQVNDKPVMQYRLKVSGAPHNKFYNLIAWPIMFPEPATMMEGLVIAADGTVGCPPDSTKSCAQHFKGAELKLTYSPAIGEIFRHALVSEDHQTRIFFSVVPAPMIESDKSCSLELIRASPKFALALVHGKGFTPGDKLSFHTQSYQEVHDSQPTVDAHGEFWAILTPFIKGRTMGTTEVQVRGKSCAPTLAFEWGSE